MAWLLAVVISLDFYLHIQIAVLALAFMVATLQSKGIDLRRLEASIAILTAVLFYLALNTISMIAYDADRASNWSNAPLRAFLYYLMLVATWLFLRDRIKDREFIFSVINKLFLLKVSIIFVEILYFVLNGSFRDTAAFNIIEADSIWQSRFGSSYDILFTLLLFNRSKTVSSAVKILIIIAACQTRAVMALAAAIFIFELLRNLNLKSMILAVAATWTVAALALVNADGAHHDSRTEMPYSRLAQLAGSSLSDKFVQLELVLDQFPSGEFLLGAGLGASLPELVRDQSRPYAYEAQLFVVLWQGGIVFYILNTFVLVRLKGLRVLLPYGLVLAVSATNPVIFGFSAAMLLLTCQHLPVSRKRLLLTEARE